MAFMWMMYISVYYIMKQYYKDLDRDYKDLSKQEISEIETLDFITSVEDGKYAQYIPMFKKELSEFKNLCDELQLKVDDSLSAFNVTDVAPCFTLTLIYTNEKLFILRYNLRVYKTRPPFLTLSAMAYTDDISYDIILNISADSCVELRKKLIDWINKED